MNFRNTCSASEPRPRVDAKTNIASVFSTKITILGSSLSPRSHAIKAAFLLLLVSGTASAQSPSPCATDGTCTCAQMAADCRNYYPADVCKKADPFCHEACRASGGKTASFVGPASGKPRVARCK